MTEDEQRSVILARREKLVQEREVIDRLIATCDVLLAEVSPEVLPVEVRLTASVEVPPPAVVAEPVCVPAVVEVNSSGAASRVVEGAFLGPFYRYQQQRRGSLMARVEAAVGDCGGAFSVDQVVAAFRARFKTKGRPSREQIAATFWRLARNRGYRVLRPGAGRTPALYGR